MGRFILRRLGFMVLTVILASIVIFWATTVLPGDVAGQILGRYSTEEAKTQLRHELGLDRPSVQYVTGSATTCGDWGDSPYDTSVRSCSSAAQPIHAMIVARYVRRSDLPRC
jgi:peptide/nickel transport system permease protein